MIEQIPVGPMLNYAYLLADGDAGSCAVVDPGWDSQTLIDKAKAGGVRIEKILLTHVHFDHVGALGDLVSETGAKIFVHRLEAGELSGDLKLEMTEDGSKIELGSLSIDCLHTPGHSPGSQCFMTDGNIFTGDTLFIDGCGRVDLPGSSPREMVKSLGRLSKLNSGVTVWPGHDYGGPKSTIGELIQTNPYLGSAGKGAPL